MLCWTHQIGLKDHIRSKEIRKRAKVKPIVSHVTKQLLSWYGHIRRREPGDITGMVLDEDIPGKRLRGLPRIRWMDNIGRGMKTYGLDDEMAEERKVWSKLVETVDTH